MLRHSFLLALLLALIAALAVVACAERSTGGDAALSDAALSEAIRDARQPSTPEAGDHLVDDAGAVDNGICSHAARVDLPEGHVLIAGSTRGAANEFGEEVRCGETSGFVGPQRYYAVPLLAAQTYRFVVRPQFDAVAYVFSECTPSLLNIDCSSAGATGIATDVVRHGTTGTFYFTPPATGSYRLAVDSLSSDQSGPFEVEVEAPPALAHRSCARAKPLALDAGSVLVEESTRGALDESGAQLTCGLGVSFDGPQLYYSVELEAGAWYRFQLAPQFAAGLYVVSQAGGCEPAKHHVDCGGLNGTVLAPVAAGSQAATAFSPRTSGPYLVAVDSVDPEEAGAFSLTITAISPSGNMTCGAAQPLEFETDEISINGDTSSYLNDRGVLLACRGQPQLGPQAYYTVPLEQRTYQLLLTPSFAAELAIGTSCLTLPADCSSDGLDGVAREVSAGSEGALLFHPRAAGTYVVAVDGLSPSAAGPFALRLRSYRPAENGSCAQPAAMTLGTSPVEVRGDTGPFVNEFSGIRCGSPQGPWMGPQAYYRLSLRAGVRYTLTLLPEPSFDPALYGFTASTACTAAAIDQACAALSSDVIGAGLPEQLVITPTSDVDYLVVVDAWSPSEVGAFTLQVTWP